MIFPNFGFNRMESLLQTQISQVIVIICNHKIYFEILIYEYNNINCIQFKLHDILILKMIRN